MAEGGNGGAKTKAYAAASPLASGGWELASYDGLKFSYTEETGVVCKGLADGADMTEVNIPDNVVGYPVKAIGDYAFYSQWEIKSISIPSTVTKIGERAFNGCSSLTSVTFAEGSQLETIGDYVFVNTAIESLVIPSSVKKMGSEICYGCESLTSVSFKRVTWNGDVSQGIAGNDLEGYESNLGRNLNSQLTIYVPAGCEDVYKAKLTDYTDQIQGEDIVDKSLKFELNEAKDGLTCTGLVEGQSDLAEVNIPAKVQGAPVTAIGEKAFYENSSVTSVSIPSTVKEISKEAFYNCQKLKYIFVPTGTVSAYAAQLPSVSDFIIADGGKLELTDAAGFACEDKTLYRASNLSYERTLDAKGEYATLCLPYALDLGKTADIFDKVYVPMNTLIHNTAKSTSELEHFVLMLEEQASDAIIPAGQPIFVKLSDTENKITLSNSADEILTADLQPKSEAMKVVDWDGTSGLMTQNKQFSISYGSLYQPKSDISADDHIWSFNANGSFGPQTSGTMPPFRLFLTVLDDTPSVQAKAYSISIGVSDGTTTGIREIISSDDAISTSKPNASSAHAGIIYDLNGRKIATASEAQHLSKGIYILNGKKMVVK